MMRGCFLLLAGLLVSSCDRSDYVIDIQRAHIEHISENGGSGYIVVGKETADNMAGSASGALYAKFCPGSSCKPVPVDSVNGYDQEIVAGGVRLKLEFSDGLLSHDHPKFWLKDVACLKVEVGRAFGASGGKSDWNCAVKIEAAAR